jgi:hypothetical protein
MTRILCDICEKEIRADMYGQRSDVTIVRRGSNSRGENFLETTDAHFECVWLAMQALSKIFEENRASRAP